MPGLFESQGDEDDQQALDSWGSLILIMMYEYLLGNQSKWKPYMDILPETFDTPMFWSDEELSQLQASATLTKIGKASAEEMFRSRLVPAIRSNPAIFRSSGAHSDEDLIRLAHRMGSTIMAYAFDLESDNEEEDDESDSWIEDRDGKLMMGMVAMADILNADAEFNVRGAHSRERNFPGESAHPGMIGFDLIPPGTCQPRGPRVDRYDVARHQGRGRDSQLLRPASQF